MYFILYNRVYTFTKLFFILVFLGNLFTLESFAQDVKAVKSGKPSKAEIVSAPMLSAIEELPGEISPEGVQALIGLNIPFILVDADEANAKNASSTINANPNKTPAKLIRHIYYTTSPSFRLAQTLANNDRKATPATSVESAKLASQRLTGTPLEWNQLKLKFDKPSLPAGPLVIKPKQLSEAIKDGVDIQIIDLRPISPNAEASPFPQSLRVLPHQIETEMPKLSKQRWIVVVDGGNRAAWPIADKLFQEGFLLTTLLEGGYPAWVAETKR